MYESTSLGVHRRSSGHEVSGDLLDSGSGGTAVLKQVVKKSLSRAAFSWFVLAIVPW